MRVEDSIAEMHKTHPFYYGALAFHETFAHTPVEEAFTEELILAAGVLREDLWRIRDELDRRDHPAALTIPRRPAE